MKKAEIADKIRGIVIEQLGLGENQYIETNDFINDMGADSLDTIELIMAVEEEFGILIDYEEAEPIRTPEQAVDALCKRLAIDD